MTTLYVICWAALGYSVEIDVLTVSPRLVENDESGFFDRTATGHPVIGIGQKAYLQVMDDNLADITSVAWTIAEQPAGSNPVLSANDQLIISFDGDTVGVYQLTATVQFSNAQTEETTQRLVVADYSGAGGISGGSPSFPQCGACHPGNWSTWKETEHAQVLQEYLNGERGEEYTPGNLAFHTLGFDPSEGAVNGGFDDVAREAGLDLQSIADQVNQAFSLNQDNDPANDVAFFDSLPDAVKAKSNVQCESCHGPGSQHLGDKTKIGFSWGAEFCASCHDDPHSSVVPFIGNAAPHSTLVDIFDELPVLLKSECAECHSAQGFVTLKINHNQDELSNAEVKKHGVSCAACHDPHERKAEHQLRIQGDVELKSGHVFTSDGAGSICATCHQSRIETPLDEFIQSNRGGVHYGPQTDVVMGINAWDFGQPLPPVQSVHTLFMKDTCVTCHMATVPENGLGEDQQVLVGGHSFKIINRKGTEDPGDDISNVRNACFPCHLEIKTPDRVLSWVKDLDGDRRMEGVQTEVKGLLARIAIDLQQRYPEIVIPADGDFAVPSSVFAQMSFEEKAVVHNYRLVLRDKSYGVHNTPFTIAALTRALEAIEH